MLKLKTDKDHLITLRNEIAAGIVKNRANIEYWVWVSNHSKHDSQEMVDSKNNIKINEDNIGKDIVFLKCIDKMLQKQN